MAMGLSIERPIHGVALAGDESPRTALVRLAILAGWLGFVVVVLFVATYHLDRYPVTWFDEGSHLHVPQDLVWYGVYADRSSEGFRYFGPTIGVGPTVMLPIALVFRLAGVGLLQARLVVAVYAMGSVVLFGLLARAWYGAATALL